MDIIRATGASITEKDLLKSKTFYVSAYIKREDPVSITEGINKAISEAAIDGGTVIFEARDYRCYTIELKSHVNLYLEEGATIYAAKTDFDESYFSQIGEGGNYKEPEINKYAGLQDHGHTYFANSLIYGADIEDVMIYGKGLIDGSFYNEETGVLEYVLWGGDPDMGHERDKKGHNGHWFGNKAIALLRCKNVVLKDFSLVIGGHFAIIAEGVTNMLIDNILVDTTRDAVDIDCCQDVTVINSTFNSLTDDALVIKSSYGAGLFMPAKNILIDNCIVSGYDAKSVYMKQYTCDKLVAEDRCGPTGRMKLGTESSCGYEVITITNVKFEHSRGFALEAVDCSDLHDVIFENCEMENVSSSPIFIRVGDRQRFPVTGNTTSKVIGEKNEVRLDNPEYVIPNLPEYDNYPQLRYTPSYNYTLEVSNDGKHTFTIVDGDNPTRINENAMIKDIYHANVTSRPIAKVYNIKIANVRATNVDPRYPIIIAGLMDSKVSNLVMENIYVEYRGGLDIKDAVYQDQINTCYEYKQYQTAKSKQIVPWMVNKFFCKNEGLLVRADYNKETKKFELDPYNVPELVRSYPEPSMFGILPAYGMYLRHVDNVTLKDITTKFIVPDTRHAVVLDDVNNITLEQVKFDIVSGVEEIALVTNNYKRRTGFEYVKNEPYCSTKVTAINIEETHSVKEVIVNSPSPGTPNDDYYDASTVPTLENGFVDERIVTLPKTVIRPYFVGVGVKKVPLGESLVIKIKVRDPYSETVKPLENIRIYNESVEDNEYVYMGTKRDIAIKLITEDEEVEFNEENGIFKYTPKYYFEGKKEFVFEGDDKVMKFYGKIVVEM